MSAIRSHFTDETPEEKAELDAVDMSPIKAGEIVLCGHCDYKGKARMGSVVWCGNCGRSNKLFR